MTDTEERRIDPLAASWYTTEDAACIREAERITHRPAEDFPEAGRRARAELLYAFRLAVLDGTKGGALDGAS